MKGAVTSSADHPAPQRDRTSTAGLILALAASPAGWIAQLSLGYGLSSLACYPRDAPLRESPPAGWGGEHLLLAAINLVCLLAPLAGGWAALTAWRRTRTEKPGGAETLLDAGEGRTRFLATCAMMAAVAFGLAILFNTASAVGAPACWDIAK